MGGISHAFSRLPAMPIDLNEQLRRGKASLVSKGPWHSKKEDEVRASHLVSRDNWKRDATGCVESPNLESISEVTRLTTSEWPVTGFDGQHTGLLQIERELLHFVGGTCKAAQPASAQG